MCGFLVYKYLMRIFEIQAVKPQTPEQTRIKGLQQGVERSREALQAERDKQRQQRDTERKKRMQLPSSTCPGAST